MNPRTLLVVLLLLSGVQVTAQQAIPLQPCVCADAEVWLDNSGSNLSNFYHVPNDPATAWQPAQVSLAAMKKLQYLQAEKGIIRLGFGTFGDTTIRYQALTDSTELYWQAVSRFIANKPYGSTTTRLSPALEKSMTVFADPAYQAPDKHPCYRIIIVIGDGINHDAVRAEILAEELQGRSHLLPDGWVNPNFIEEGHSPPVMILTLTTQHPRGDLDHLMRLSSDVPTFDDSSDYMGANKFFYTVEALIEYLQSLEALVPCG